MPGIKLIGMPKKTSLSNCINWRERGLSLLLQDPGSQAAPALSEDLPVQRRNNEELIVSLQAWVPWLTRGHNLVANISRGLCQDGNYGNYGNYHNMSVLSLKCHPDNKTNQAGSRAGQELVF